MQALSRWIAGSIIVLAAPLAHAGDAWPQFRGPTQQGVSDAAPGTVPTTWSETEHVKWKTPIAGQGWSSPVILDKQIWITSALDDGKSLHALCIHQDTGKLVYDIELFTEDALEPKNSFNSYASPTPVLESGRAYVSFGSYGNACIDTATGKVIWKNSDLKINHMEGAGSSPIVYGNWMVLHCDGADVQYVALVDKQTGKLALKLPRSFPLTTLPPDQRKAYCIPTFITIDGRDEMVSVGSHRVSGFSLPDATEQWHVDLLGWSNAPRPVFADGLLYVSTGYMNAELWAIRPPTGAASAEAQVVWKWKQGAPLKPSVLIAGDLIYFISDNGIARCLEAKTGQQVWQGRILGGCSASPILAGGLIYFCDEHGKTVVLRPGRTLDTVAENQLTGRILASPAVVGNAIFVRTDQAMYRLEN